MKKIYVLVALGAFLIGLGVLSRVYLYDQVAVVPADLDSKVIAESAPDDPATYFNIAELSEASAVLASQTVAQVDAKLSEEASDDLNRDVLVIRTYACSDLAEVDCRTIRLPLSGTDSVFAIDPSTSMPVEWNGTEVSTGGETDTDVVIEGLTIKFPFNAQKSDDYAFWNADLDTSVPVEFVKQTEVDGLTAYEYRQELEPTVLGQIDIPGSIVGSTEPSITVDRVASSVTTYLVEPRSGVILKATSSLDNYAAIDGERAFALTKGTFTTPDDVVAETVEEYKPLSKALWAVRTGVPVGGVIFGVLLLVLAGFLSRRRNRQVAGASHDEPSFVGAR